MCVRVCMHMCMCAYVCMYVCVFCVHRPPGECYQAFKGQFLLFSCVLSKFDSAINREQILVLGFVMMLQFRYQRAKLYRHIAMGKKHHLSVSQGNIQSIYHHVYAVATIGWSLPYFSQG